MSENFGPVDLEHLNFPVHMRVDYIRVYQMEDAINIGCDPEDFPTQAYINRFLFTSYVVFSLLTRKVTDIRKRMRTRT